MSEHETGRKGGINYIMWTFIIYTSHLLLCIMSFMQDIYTYMPQTNYVSREKCCNYSFVTVHGAYNAVSNVKSIALVN
jgi:hypothetical protein